MRKVTDTPRGKRVPFGWVRVTALEAVLRPKMFVRPCWWLGASGWEPVPQWWVGEMLEDVGDWLVIRRMAPKELKKAKEGKT